MSDDYEQAVAFAAEHLNGHEAHAKNDTGLWIHGLLEKYGIVERSGAVTAADIGRRELWFSISEDDAARLVSDAETDAAAWDLARSVVAHCLLRDRPLPRALREFVVAALIERYPRPRMSKTYGVARRDAILSRIIMDVWMIFGLSEQKSRQAVHDGARQTGFAVPADLRDLWEKSAWKHRGLPERTPERRRTAIMDAAERLKELAELQSRLGESQAGNNPTTAAD